jgi:hypothetical protein
MRTRALASLVGLVLVLTVDVAAGQTSSVPVEPASSVVTGLPASIVPIPGVSGRRALEGAAVPSDDSERPCCSNIVTGAGTVVRSADGDGRVALS